MALLGALGHLANLGQFAEIAQGHTHQKEQIRWTRRNFALDAQALKIDLLGAARSDVRGTYDTYLERLDSMLLLNALLFPFALNTLQFSDEFVPGLNCYSRHDPEECVEVRNPWLHTIWVYLVALDLVTPFWSILLLLRCKSQLDAWLQQTQDDLQDLRRSIIAGPAQLRANATMPEDKLADDQQRVVEVLSTFIVDYQDQFIHMWEQQCAPLISLATKLLWSSATLAVMLTAYMCWIYLADLEYNKSDHIHFAVIAILGLLAPAIHLSWHRRYRCQPPLQTGVIANYASDERGTSEVIERREGSQSAISMPLVQVAGQGVSPARSDLQPALGGSRSGPLLGQ